MSEQIKTTPEWDFSRAAFEPNVTQTQDKTTAPARFVTVNLNDKVRFQFLGEKGENVWRAYWAPYCGGLDVFEFLPADENGWRETELHILMQVIGPSFVGSFTPIDTDIQVEVKRQ